MRLLPSILGGLAGAVAVTLIHEVLKRTDDQAPRMDKLGMEAIADGMEEMDQPVPDTRTLGTMAFIGEILANTAYYSLTGIGRRSAAEKKGSILGIIAGLGSIFLPKPMGLNEKHSNKSAKTRLMAMGLYFLGGYIASKVTKALDEEAEEEEIEEELALAS